MRKNIARVIEAFKKHESCKEPACHTDGRVFYSYGTPIAVYKGRKVLVTTKKFSATTSKQTSSILVSFPGESLKLVEQSVIDTTAANA